MGRPTLLDDLRAKRIVDAIAAGASRSAAAEAANVDRSTLMQWLRKGRLGEDQRYVDFLHRVKVAEAQAENELIAVIRTAAPKSWQAAAWLLERRQPKRYALTAARFEKASPGANTAAQEADGDLIEAVYAAHKSRVGT